MTSKKTEIVLGVTGSIAAYKSAALLRMMVKAGWQVSVMMTEAATHFVGPLTFQTLSQRRVAITAFDKANMWMPEHISLADIADVMVIAPCTANVIAKFAHGLADDLVTSTFLACQAPKIVAPAMNDGMWANAATQENIAILKRRGIGVVDVGSGYLACDRVGQGRMADIEDIFAAIERKLI